MKTLEKNIAHMNNKTYITITHKEMDNLFSIIENIEFPSVRYLPTLEDIAMMKKNISKYYTFILWILSNPNGLRTKEEEKIEKELNHIIMKHTKIKASKQKEELEDSYDELLRQGN